VHNWDLPVGVWLSNNFGYVWNFSDVDISYFCLVNIIRLAIFHFPFGCTISRLNSRSLVLYKKI